VASSDRATAATDAPDGAVGAAAGGAADRLRAEITKLEAELREIEMLINQARVEAERHEEKRSQTANKLSESTNLPFDDVLALNTQLVTLTRRASVMEAQVEVLEGKRKILTRFRETLASFFGADLDAVATTSLPGGTAGHESVEGAATSGADPGGSAAAPMSRIVLNAQEDLRREIARQMHDGPAQSLTNIVLQAQIVERLMARDPDAAKGEARLLTSMVQHTLDATKTFIFDVRPMVLDDLGLVPTLRRSARERGRRASVPVDFDSAGQDRRLPVEIESSLFRILDEALAAYIGSGPDRVVLRLDWGEDRVAAQLSATRKPTSAMADAEQEVVESRKAADVKDVPPAIEQMLAQRVENAEAAAVAAREAAIVALPQPVWREIQQRATSVGIAVQLLAGGGELRVSADTGDSGQRDGDDAIAVDAPRTDGLTESGLGPR
jgi:two-component system sensor histidine kinase DegS